MTDPSDLGGISNDQLMAMYNQAKQQRTAGFVAPPTAAPDKIAQRQEYGQAVQSLRKERESMQAYQPIISSLDRFGDLNKEAGTGGLLQSFMLNHGLDRNPAEQEMNSIGSQLQISSVPKGQGAISDFERSLFARGVPSVQNIGDVNASIRGHMKATYAQNQDFLDFKEQYLNRNGTLSGAQAAWSKYAQDNPYEIANKNKSGASVVQVNPQRTPWKQYFGLEAGQQASPNPRAQAAQTLRGGAQPAQPGRVVVDLSGRPVK